VCLTCGRCVGFFVLFFLRSSYFCSQAKDEDASPLGDVDYLLIVAGNSDEDNPYRKGSAIQVPFLSFFFLISRLTCFCLQTYLLGYEFPSTLMLLGKRKVYFVVSASKGKFCTFFFSPPKLLAHRTFSAAKLLQPIAKAEGDNKVEVEILTRSKDEAENKKLFEQIIQTIGENVRFFFLTSFPTVY
jgi:nucleosome binding factor SPN SPT16 subunit